MSVFVVPVVLVKLSPLSIFVPAPAALKSESKSTNHAYFDVSLITSLTKIFEPAVVLAFLPSDKKAYLSSKVPCVPVNLPCLSIIATCTSSFVALFFVAKSDVPGAASNRFYMPID